MIPVITIDGTSGCGKGTLAHALARDLGWHYLDSGALYRIVAYAASCAGVEPENSANFASFVAELNIQFKDADDLSGFKVYCNGDDVSQQIRTAGAGKAASVVSAMPMVRDALFDLQLSFRQLPGLVTDGRDMGTVVFPDATAKIFLTASVETRAERRWLQLQANGEQADLNLLKKDLAERDERDRTRATAPMVAASDAYILDTSAMSIEQVLSEAKSFVLSRI